MYPIIRCHVCQKQSFIPCEGFTGKDVTIALNIKRFHKICKECFEIKDLDYNLYFCSIKCLKEFVVKDLDTYFEDEVMWGKLYRENPHLNKVATGMCQEEEKKEESLEPRGYIDASV